MRRWIVLSGLAVLAIMVAIQFVPMTTLSSSTALASAVRACCQVGIVTSLALASTTPTSAMTCPASSSSSNEIGLEIFYNIAATDWLYVTPDIQVIEPVGQRVTTMFLTGLRLQMRF